MAKIKWDQLGERLYETGVSKGVLYVYKGGAYGKGVAWNGLTAVNENPSGGEPTPLYADNIKYLNLMSVEQFGATIEAYTYPPEFEECDGSVEVGKGITVGQQRRIPFGLCYRTEIGNDVDGNKHGYTIHIVYGLQVPPTGKEYGTINEDPEAITFSWESTATPVEVPWENCDPTAHIKINSTDCDKSELKALEDMLYGTDETEPKFPMPEDLVKIFNTPAEETISLSVNAMDGNTEVYGLNVNELQSDIIIGESDITGTLLYVSSYTGFNDSDVSEQSGNYLALKVEIPEGATVKTQLINGKKGAVDMTADKYCVYRITDEKTQKVVFTVSKGDETKTSIYGLTGLTLNEA